jgi:hypothetical protein
VFFLGQFLSCVVTLSPFIKTMCRNGSRTCVSAYERLERYCLRNNWNALWKKFRENFTIMDLGSVFASAYRARSELDAMRIMCSLLPRITSSQVVTYAKTAYPALFGDLGEREPELLLREIGCVLYMKEPHDPLLNLEWREQEKVKVGN